tara:strand:- start:1011 stop:2255 length:1245 start_codon:yes stop_codon:yes gene_type:complete
MPVLGIKSQAIIEELLLFQSQTWTCHQTGLVKVVCIGGGGSGAMGVGNWSSNLGGRATGGGAGGYSEQLIPVTKGDTYTVTIGAAAQGKAKAAGASAGFENGNAGGASRFVTASGTTIDLNAGGGGAGAGEINDGGSSSYGALAGGTGGSASGGTTNRVGGAGGAILTGSVAYPASATGGGAVAIRSPVGFAGGSLQPKTANTNIQEHYATGGGGVGGGGGAVTANATYGTANQGSATNGGGTGGPGIDNGSGSSPVSTGVPKQASTAGGTGMIAGYAPGTIMSFGSQSIESNFLVNDNTAIQPRAGGAPHSVFSVFGSGGSYVVSGSSNKREQAGPGGGGGGFAARASVGANLAGLFGGGGGTCSAASNTNATGVGGPMGGGSGGAIGMANNNAGGSGPGGCGVVVIQYLSLT